MTLLACFPPQSVEDKLAQVARSIGQPLSTGEHIFLSAAFP